VRAAGAAVRRPTIESVAARAGVSKSLVSLVMRGSPHVSAGRREAVLKAAAELGYRPNLAARQLVERRTRTMGVLVSDLHNPFFAEVIDGMQEEAHARGLDLLLATGRRDPGEEAHVVERFLQQGVEGLVLLAAVCEPAVMAAAARTTATVLVSRADVRVARCDVIVDDDALGARLAVDHLVELGHRRIAHLAAPGAPGGPGRRAGFEAAMAEHGLTGDAVVVVGDVTDEGGYGSTRELLARAGSRPTAIFAPNDLAAIGALTALEEAGLRVPDDMSLVGYDNSYLASIRHIALTSVDQPRLEMGRLATRCAAERYERPARRARKRTVTPHLVVRGSTAPAFDNG
jgi:DNA-binding LacI/PurR family transcriptional regulator